MLLGHADRSRIVSPDLKGWTEVGWGCVLVDGFTAARWKLERGKEMATLLIEPFRAMTRLERTQVFEEGARLAAFLAEDAGVRDIRFAGVRS